MSSDGEGKARRSLAAAGTVLTVAGVSVVNPGVKDAIVSLLNKTFGLGLSLDASVAVGAALIAIGILLLLLAFFGPERAARGLDGIFGSNRRDRGMMLIVKHVGFKPVVRDVRTDELPSAHERRAARHLLLDLSDDVTAGRAGLKRALSTQLGFPDRLAAAMATDADASLGYCGVVQAPFQLLAGHQLSTWVAVQHFEWQRNETRWIALHPGPGPDLGVARRDETVGSGGDVGIAVEASYAVATADITASVASIGRIVRLSASPPRLDAVTHEGQVAAFATAFRAVLDELHAALPHGTEVHVFCAASMSIGFGLGRQVSRTLHPPLVVHAYDRQALKSYAWGVRLNPGQGRPALVFN